MTGQIIYAARTQGFVTGAVRVDEGPGKGVVEYVATVPYADPQGIPYTGPQLRAALVAAWSAQRAMAQANSIDVSSQINGQVVL